MLQMPRIQSPELERPPGLPQMGDLSPEKGSDRHKVPQQSKAEQDKNLKPVIDLGTGAITHDLRCLGQQGGLPGEPACSIL